MKKVWLFLWTILLVSPIWANTATKPNEAVIVMFHKFGVDTSPSTNIRMEQLHAFVKYIKQEGFTVLPLTQVVEYMQDNTPLPEKTVVITIDDAHKSLYTHAYPVFKEAKFPFTVFLSSREVGLGNFLSWDNITEMAQHGVDFQAHTHTHPHMQTLSADEVVKEITTNVDLITKHTGIKPTIFAYPYGEASTDVIHQVKTLGFKAGFSQHSGVFNKTSNMFYAPRFSINERYGTLNRLKLVLNARAFPITQYSPINPYITDDNPPTISLTVAPSIKNLHSVNCFFNGRAKMHTTKNAPHIVLSFDAPFTKGRSRINCTIPHPDGRGYGWFGLQYVK